MADITDEDILAELQAMGAQPSDDAVLAELQRMDPNAGLLGGPEARISRPTQEEPGIIDKVAQALGIGAQATYDPIGAVGEFTKVGRGPGEQKELWEDIVQKAEYVPAAEIAGAMVAGPGAGLVGSAVRSGLGAEGGRLVEELLGARETATIPERAERVGEDVATGWLLGKGVNFLRNVTGGSKRFAKMMGATKGQMDEETAGYITGKIDDLRTMADEGDDVARRVFAAKDPETGLAVVKEELDDIGRQIAEVHKNSGGVKFSVDDIRNHPLFEKVTDIATAPKGTGELLTSTRTASNVLKSVDNALPSSGDISAPDLISLRKKLDSLVDKSFTSTGKGAVTERNQMIRDIGNAFRDVINSSDNLAIRELNERYSALRPIKSMFSSGAAGQKAGIDELASSVSGGKLIGTALTGGMATPTARKALEATRYAPITAGQAGVSGSSLIRSLLGEER